MTEKTAAGLRVDKLSGSGVRSSTKRMLSGSRNRKYKAKTDGVEGDDRM